MVRAATPGSLTIGPDMHYDHFRVVLPLARHLSMLHPPQQLLHSIACRARRRQPHSANAETIWVSCAEQGQLCATPNRQQADALHYPRHFTRAKKPTR